MFFLTFQMPGKSPGKRSPPTGSDSPAKRGPATPPQQSRGPQELATCSRNLFGTHQEASQTHGFRLPPPSHAGLPGTSQTYGSRAPSPRPAIPIYGSRVPPQRPPPGSRAPPLGPPPQLPPGTSQACSSRAPPPRPGTSRSYADATQMRYIIHDIYNSINILNQNHIIGLTPQIITIKYQLLFQNT